MIKRRISEGEILIRLMFHTKNDENKNKKLIFFAIKYYEQESIVFASRIKRFSRKLLPNLTVQFAF